MMGIGFLDRFLHVVQYFMDLVKMVLACIRETLLAGRVDNFVVGLGSRRSGSVDHDK